MLAEDLTVIALEKPNNQEKGNTQTHLIMLEHAL